MDSFNTDIIFLYFIYLLLFIYLLALHCSSFCSTKCVPTSFNAGIAFSVKALLYDTVNNDVIIII